MLTRIGRGYARSAPLALAFKSKFLLLLLTSLFVTVSFLSAQGGGISGYDLKSTSDLAFAFDYNGSGQADHLVFYRPGTGVIYIVANNSHSGQFGTVFSSVNGIGGYDLLSPNDRIFAFDFNGSGLLDHLVLYRPGTGIIWILANNAGTFTPVLTSAHGLADYDLMSTADRVFAFDYNGNGLSDHLVMYRPGTGIVYIMQNSNGTFSSVFQSTNGIGTYDLMSTADQMFAFDLYGIGVADHLVAYRPGTGMVDILANNQGTFGAEFVSTTGIGSYDLKVSGDQLAAYDYAGNGNPDHLIAYRPGTGIVYILKTAYFDFVPVFQSTTGIGGYDLLSTADRIFPFDFAGTGRSPNLVLYRPGAGIIWILGNSAGTFTPVFASAPEP